MQAELCVIGRCYVCCDLVVIKTRLKPSACSAHLYSLHSCRSRPHSTTSFTIVFRGPYFIFQILLLSSYLSLVSVHIQLLRMRSLLAQTRLMTSCIWSGATLNADTGLLRGRAVSTILVDVTPDLATLSHPLAPWVQ